MSDRERIRCKASRGEKNAKSLGRGGRKAGKGNSNLFRFCYSRLGEYDRWTLPVLASLRFISPRWQSRPRFLRTKRSLRFRSVEHCLWCAISRRSRFGFGQRAEFGEYARFDLQSGIVHDRRRDVCQTEAAESPRSSPQTLRQLHNAGDGSRACESRSQGWPPSARPRRSNLRRETKRGLPRYPIRP